MAGLQDCTPPFMRGGEGYAVPWACVRGHWPLSAGPSPCSEARSRPLPSPPPSDIKVRRCASSHLLLQTGRLGRRGHSAVPACTPRVTEVPQGWGATLLGACSGALCLGLCQLPW